MQFKTWLEVNDDRPVFTFWKNGTVIIYMRRVRYEYRTDAGYHERWRIASRYSPFKVWNEIKDQVKSGHAEQLEPPLKKDPPETPKAPKSTQQFLF